MELKSTASFKDIDIDSMLEHTSFDEFMKGLYMSKVASKPAKGESKKTDFEKMWESVMVSEEEKKDDLNLNFGDKE